MSKLRKAEADLRRHNTDPTTYRDGSMGINVPLDTPAYIRAYRLMGNFELEEGRVIEGLKGWTVQFDAFTFDVKFFIRIGRDGTLRLFIQEGDGKPVKLKEWEK